MSRGGSKFSLTSRIAELIKNSRQNTILRRITKVMAVFVVFITTYALILPALTLSSDSVTVYESSLGTNASFTYTISNVSYSDSTYSGHLYVSFSSLSVDAIKDSNYTITVALPDGLEVPSGLQNTTLYGSAGSVSNAFTYVYTYDDTTGIWSATITFSDSFLSSYSGTTVDGYFELDANIDSSNWDKTDHELEFTIGTATLTISEEDISTASNETPNADVSVSKSAGNFDASTNSITYTIYVSSTAGTTDVVNIADTLTLNGLTADSITIDSVTYNGTAISSGSAASSSTYTATTNASSGSLSMTLYNMDANSSYTIKYTVYLSGTDLDENTDVVNAVNASTTDKDWTSGGTTISDGDSVTKTVSYNVLSKSGTANSDGTITWTIIVNTDRQDIAGFTLTDTIFNSNSSSLQSSDITISGGTSSDYTVSTDGSGNVTGITFNATNGSTNTNTYTITYTTTMDTLYLGDYDSESNTATLADMDTTISKTAWVSASGGSIDKEYVSSAAGTGDELLITWSSKVTIPEAGIAKGTVITDYLGGTSLQTNAGTATQYFTYSQLSTLNSALYVNVYSTDNNTYETNWSIPADTTNFTVEVYDVTAGAWVTLTEAIQNTNGTYADHLFTAFRITFNTVVSFGEETYFTLSYTSTADTSSLSTSLTFTNYMEAAYNYHTVGDSASHTITANVAKTDGKGNSGDSTVTIDDADDTITWKVQIKIPQFDTGDDTSAYAYLTVTDTLPTGVVFDSVRVTESGGYYHDGTLTSTNTTYTSYHYTSTPCLELTLNGQEVTVKISEDYYKDLYSTGGYVYLTYTCSLSDTLKAKIAEVLADSSTTSVTFDAMTNSVSVTDANNSTYGTDSQTQTVTYEEPNQSSGNDILSKTGTWDSANSRYTYEVIINPDAEDLVDTSDTLSFTDTLKTYYSSTSGFYASLLTDTVKFYAYNASKQEYEELTDVVWYYTTTEEELYNTGSGQYNVYHVISASVPDATNIKLVYTYKITAVDSTTTSLNTNISNTASLGNYTTQDATYTSGWQDSYSLTASAGVDVKNYFSLQKYDKDKGMGCLLQGATYTVYMWNGSGWESTSVTFTTDSNGSLSFTTTNLGTYYAPNTAYYLVESSAPSGYACDTDTKYYFYWSDSDTSSYPEAYPDNWSTDYSAHDLASVTAEIYAANSTQTDKYTSVTVNKTWANGTAGASSVSVDLYRYSSTEVLTATEAATSVSSSDDLVTLYIDFGFNYYDNNANSYALITDIVKGTDVTVDISDYSINGYVVYVKDGSSYTTKISWTSNSTFTIAAADVTGDIYLDIWVNNGTFSESNFAVTYTKGVVGSANNTGEYLPTSATWSDLTKLDSYSITLNDSNSWSYTLDNLPAGYYDSNGIYHYYYYFFKEQTLSGYVASYSTTDGINSGSITITNTVDNGTWDYTALSVAKSWEYVNDSQTAVPDSAKTPVTIGLYRVTNGDTSTAELLDTIILGADAAAAGAVTGWTYNWSGLLNSYTPDGGNTPTTTYTYYVAEIDGSTSLTSWSGTGIDTSSTITVAYGSDNYTAYKVNTSSSATALASESNAAATAVTNYVKKTTSLAVTKSWQYSDGTVITSPADTPVTVTLYRTATTSGSGSSTSGAVSDSDLSNGQKAAMTLGASSNSDNSTTDWTYTWTDLPVASDDGKTTYSYYIVETTVSGYTTYYATALDASDNDLKASASDLAGESAIYVINRYDTSTTTASVTKAWTDGTTTISDPSNATASFTLIQVLYALSDTTYSTPISAVVYDANTLDSTIDGEITLGSGTWSYSWSGLPTTGTYEVDNTGSGGSKETLVGVYRYYIVESSAVYGSQTTGFSEAYSDGTNTITGTGITLTGEINAVTYYLVSSGGSVTVTNTVQKSITLPLTGGSGMRQMIVMFGCGAALFAISVLLARKRRMRRWTQ